MMSRAGRQPKAPCPVCQTKRRAVPRFPAPLGSLSKGSRETINKGGNNGRDCDKKDE